MGVRPSASPTSSVPSSIKIGLSLRPDSWCGGSNRVWNLLHYGDTSLGLLVTCPLRIPQVWRGDGPQVDSVSVFYYYHLLLDITTSIVIYVFIYVGWCMWVILLYPHVYNSTSTSRIYETYSTLYSEDTRLYSRPVQRVNGYSTAVILTSGCMYAGEDSKRQVSRDELNLYCTVQACKIHC